MPQLERQIDADAVRAAAGEALGTLDDATAAQRAAAQARLEEARAVLAERARTHGAEFATWARDTGVDLAERAGPVVAERSTQARDELTRRWHELEEELPVDVDTVGQQLQRTAWQIVRAALGVLFTLPRLLVRGLGGLSELADDVADRGVVAGERAREVVAAVPPSKRERRRRCLRTAAFTGAGFGVGLAVGWFAGRSAEDPVTYTPAGLGDHLHTPVADPAATEGPAGVADEDAAADSSEDGGDEDTR